MFKKSKICTGVLLALGGSAVGFALPAIAQDVQRVEITGSSIKRIDAESSLPVTIIRAEDLAKAGVTTAEQAIGRIAASQSTLGVSQGIGGTTGGQSEASLRGLGGNKTLILLNGRRIANHAYDSGSADLNAIPFAAIDRIEVLRDGASSIYGTDAIGGVINFVLKRGYSGVDVSVEAQIPTETGGRTTRASVSGGFGSLTQQGFNIFGTLDVRRQTVAEGKDRGFSKSGVLRNADGTVRQFRTSGSSFPGDLDGFEPSLAAGCAPPSSIPNVANTSCRYDFVREIDITPKNEQATFLGRASLAVGSMGTVSLEYLRAQNDTENKVAPTPTSMTIPASSPFYPAGRPSRDIFGDGSVIGGVVNWRTVPAGKRTNQSEAIGERLLLEFVGSSGSLDYQVGVWNSKSTVKDTFTNGYINADLVQAGISAGLINPFGAQSAAGVAALEAAKIKALVLKAKGDVSTIDARVSTELGKLAGGPIGASLGVEFRREKFVYDIQDIARQAASSGLELAADTTGSRNVSALFGEVVFPILKSLEASFAVRTDRYSDSGNTVNPKLSMKWQPVKEVVLRGSITSGFRAPTLYDLYQPQQVTFTSDAYDDPTLCPGGTAVPGASAGVVCNQQVQQRFGGPAGYGLPVGSVTPEKSRSFSFGIVVAPVSGLTLGADLWNIEVKNSIGALPEQSIFEDPAKFSGRIVRCSAVPAARRGDFDTCLNFPLFNPIAYIDTPTENLGNTKTAGIDLTFEFKAPKSGFGQFTVGLEGTYVTKYDYQREKGGVFIQNVGRYSDSAPIFRWQHVATVGWDLGAINTTLSQRFKSGYLDQGPSNSVAAYSLYDLSVTWTGIKGLTLSAGVKNLLDADPPYSNQQTTFQSNYDPRFTDPLGRQYTVRAAYKF